MRFFFREDIQEKECLHWESLAKKDSRGFIVFYGIQKSMKLYELERQAEGLLAMDAEAIYGIGIEERLIGIVGSQHPRLMRTGLALFEYACRAAMALGDCHIVPVQNEGADIALCSSQEFAFLYAYIMRLHMQELHKRGKMDQIFQSVCTLMHNKGCFDLFQQHMGKLLDDQEEFERMAGYTASYVVLRGDDTCGGVLQQFADDLTEALAANGQAVIELGDNDMDFDKLQGIPLKGIVGFQAPALEIDFFRRLHGPKFQFWFDNPLHFQEVLRNLKSDEYVLCQDANYASSIRKYYHTPNAIQFFPGGHEVPLKEGYRPYDISFMGSYFPDEGERLTGRDKEFYLYMLEHSSLTFEQGALELNRGIGDEDFVQYMLKTKSACRAVIGHFRNKVIQTILDAGFELHVYGESWRYSPFTDYQNLIMHPDVSQAESLKELQKAKIGLNIMSWHKAGMTERIANIMLAGAVCLSDESAYLKEKLSDEIAIYHLEALDRLTIQIRMLLENEEMRLQLTGRAYEKAIAEYTWNARAKELIRLSEKRLTDSTVRIYVATHVVFQPPENPVYVPLHVGRNGKPDMGYLGDDTGENISDLNFLYGELTGLYWIWHNVQAVDYVGLCHYRRYFINQDMYAMSKEEYVEILKEYDAIVPKAMRCDGGQSYYVQFGQSHNSHDLDAVGRALKKLYPEYAQAFDQAMEGDIFYWGNLMVTSLSILKAYAEWLFTIFAEAGEEIDVSGYDAYHRRVYGFLSEQMFYVFATANHLRLKEVSVGVSEEKAETRELKVALRQMMQAGNVQEAKALLDARLRERPDLLLSNSDVRHELRDIYEELKKA